MHSFIFIVYFFKPHVKAHIKFSCKKFHASSVIVAATYFHEGRLMSFYTCSTEHAYQRTMSFHFLCQTKIFKLQFIFSYRSVFHKIIRPTIDFLMNQYENLTILLIRWVSDLNYPDYIHRIIATTLRMNTNVMIIWYKKTWFRHHISQKIQKAFIVT